MGIKSSKHQKRAGLSVDTAPPAQEVAQHVTPRSTPHTLKGRRRRSEGLFPCLDPILRLVAEYAETSMSAVMVLDQEYGRVISKSGNVPTGPRRSTFCLWCLLQKKDVMVIENTANHPTYWNHPVVTKSPFIRSYIGVPLHSSDGKVIGAFCIADSKPRKVTTEVKEVIRTLGRIIESRYRTETAMPPGDCLGLCDVSKPGWPISIFDKRAKQFLADRLSQGLQSLVKTDLADTFLDSLCLQIRCDVGPNCTGLSLQTSSPETKSLVFFRFVYDPTITPAQSARLTCVEDLVRKSTEVATTSKKTQNLHFGKCLGKGSYGTVYEASWNEMTVAVKIVPNSEKIQEEVNIGLQLSHVNVVKTFASEMLSVSSGKQCLIYMELCTKGSLYSTVLQSASLKNELSSVVKVALGTAMGLQHLHDRSILHGDLTGNNVLLTEDFTPKLSDFGLSRKFSGATQETQMYGTLTYMPPELLKDGLISKAMDVYSLGVLVWEMATGERAFADKRPSHIMSCKIFGSYHLEIPTYLPQKLRSLISRCLEDDYKSRPPVNQVVQTLTELSSET